MNNVICAIAKGENEYINDWCKYHLGIGFDHIYLYDNNDSTTEYVGNCIDKDILHKVTIFNVNDVHRRFFQDEVYTNFYKGYNQSFDWCAFIDLDEFIEIKDHMNIKEFLSQEIFKPYELIKLQWHSYGDDGFITRDMSIPVYSFFKQWLKEDKKLNRWCKSIVRGRINSLYFASSHMPSKQIGQIEQCLSDGTPTTFGKCVDIDAKLPEEKAWVNHYITKTLDEFLNHKFGRTDCQFEDRSLGMDYYWRVNTKTPEKEEYINRFFKQKEKLQQDSSLIKRIMENVVGCEQDDIKSISILSGGLTNFSYLVQTKNNKYVVRFPGEGTENFINRQHEKEALNIAKQNNIDTTYICMNPHHGWKISSFAENCYIPDYHSSSDSKLVIKKLHELHDKKLHVDWNFEPWQDASRLEEMIKDKRQIDIQLKKKVWKIYQSVQSDNLVEKRFCHCDAYAPNFLINKDTKEVTLLDWEYAGESDPAVDVAYYIVDAMYGFDEALQFINEYLKTDDLRLVKHFFAYIPIIAYYWFVWGVLKEELGSPVSQEKENWKLMAQKYADYFMEHSYEI